jgi:hypothetical protein
LEAHAVEISYYITDFSVSPNLAANAYRFDQTPFNQVLPPILLNILRVCRVQRLLIVDLGGTHNISIIVQTIPREISTTRGVPTSWRQIFSIGPFSL